MIDQTAPSMSTGASEDIAEIMHKVTMENVEAIAMYRASLSPWLIDTDHTTRVLHMLQAATRGGWAINKAADSWLSIEELSWGTRLSKQQVAEALVDLAFGPMAKLSRRLVDGTYCYSLGKGLGYEHG